MSILVELVLGIGRVDQRLLVVRGTHVVAQLVGKGVEGQDAGLMVDGNCFPS